MNTSILNSENLPFCRGCGHDLIAQNTARALEKSGYKPLDVTIVTDIGCHGIIDKCLNTHTVHGLHGRSAALGAGITFGLDAPEKKVIVFIGDGGATIGLQHILEAARLNLNMTVIVHNNMLYGMTGGQTSGLTPHGFRTHTSLEGNPYGGYDICALAHTAGSKFTCRIAGIGDISEKLSQAIGTNGFSLVEVIEICPSYGVKLNPKRKLTEIMESSGKNTGEWSNERPTFKISGEEKPADLLSRVSLIDKTFIHGLKHPLSVVISGSAGEGIQLAASLLCKASVRSGLSVTQKGSYPVTVGVGFSTAEINLAPDDIQFHGIDVPDVAIITSGDGLAHNRKRIEKMNSGMLLIDSSLDVPITAARIIQADFRGVGPRNAAVLAVLQFVRIAGVITAESVFSSIEQEGLSEKLPMEKIKAALQLV